MTGEGDEEFWQVLDEYRMSREGLHVKLDRGFEEGTYCIYVEFNDLASRVGVAAAHRRAGEYCGLLKCSLTALPVIRSARRRMLPAGPALGGTGTWS